MQHNAFLSRLEVNVALCPYLSHTVISRYAFDVISGFCEQQLSFELSFRSEDGLSHNAPLAPTVKAVPCNHDVLLGKDWLVSCEESDFINPFPFTDLDRVSINQIEDSPSLISVLGRDVALSRSRRCSQDIIYEILFRSYHTGVHLSAFRSSASELHSSMNLHGLQPMGLNRREATVMFLSHILNGHCHEFCHPVPRASASRDRTGCRVLSQGFDDHDSIKKYSAQLLLVANSDMISTDDLLIACEALGISLNASGSSSLRSKLHSGINSVLRAPSRYQSHPAFAVQPLERLSRPELLALIDSHHVPIGVVQRHTMNKDSLKNAFLAHLSADGTCTSVLPSGEDVPDVSEVVKHIKILQHLRQQLSARPLKRLLQIYSIPYEDSDNLPLLRKALGRHICCLKRQSAAARKFFQHSSERRAQSQSSNWPRKADDGLKHKIGNLFREATSSDALSTFVCASCAESTLSSMKNVINVSDLPKDLLEKKLPSHVETPDLYGEGDDIMLLASSVVTDSTGKARADLCPECSSALLSRKIPRLSMANDNYLGPVPDCLKNLSMVEESMIARSRCKCWIVQLKEGPDSVSSATSQHSLKGNIIVYPQSVTDYSPIMPPTLSDISAPICVLFIGSQPPSHEWLRSKARPLIVRREKIREALLWLKAHNPLYEDVVVDHHQIDQFPENDILPVHIECVERSDAIESLTANYDNASENVSLAPNDSNQTLQGFNKIVVSNVDALATTNELRAAAFRHFREQGNDVVQIPHGNLPVNEFKNPLLFPRLYPTLFPYGLGGVEDTERDTNMSFKRNIRHLFSLHDRRFQEHYSFLFITFNMLQRREILLHTALKVRSSDFNRIAQTYADVSPEAIAIVADRLSKGDYQTYHNEEEKHVLELMKEVNVITAHVPGSSAAKIQMRNEIKGLIARFGLPSFYITINPADVYNPLVKFLAGDDIDIDRLSQADVPEYHEQSLLIAKNPAIGAQFFNIYLKAFIHCILGFENDDLKDTGGILGHIKAHYGCVEAQGRGTLHCYEAYLFINKMSSFYGTRCVKIEVTAGVPTAL